MELNLAACIAADGAFRHVSTGYFFDFMDF